VFFTSHLKLTKKLMISFLR